jgi:hypothetical protein
MTHASAKLVLTERAGGESRPNRLVLVRRTRWVGAALRDTFTGESGASEAR